MAKNLSRFWMAYAALVILVVVRFLPFAMGTRWLWGVGQLTLLPTGYLLFYSILASIALVLPLVPQGEIMGESMGALFSRVFNESKNKYVYQCAVVTAMAVLFTLLRMPTHFLGDGYTYLADLGSRTGNWIRWSESGVMEGVLLIQSLLGKSDEKTTETIYQAFSIGSGMISVWLYFLIARSISKDKSIQTLAFVMLMVSPSILLYFGYVESYSLLLPPLLGSIYYGLKSADTGKGLLPALALLVP